MEVIDPPDADGLWLGEHPRGTQLAWFSLLIIGQAGLAILLLTLFLAKSLSPRMPALYNFILLSFLGTPVYLILFYTGEFMNPSPPYTQCYVQAILKHGFDPAFVLSALILLFETWQTVMRGPAGPRHPVLRNWIMLGLPYFNFLLFAIPAAVIGNRFPEIVNRGGHSFFCTIANVKFGMILGIELSIFAIGMFICQVGICYVVWKRRKATRSFGIPSIVDLSLVTRIFIFGIWEIIGLLLNSGAVKSSTLVATSFLAILPISVFVTFASQKDILRLWYQFRESRSKETRDNHTKTKFKGKLRPATSSITNVNAGR
ncbi:hypothetical protein SISSUDRAFT_1045954 [Sistotremastrum suecicum HHB10207 ss-3]|uniref:G-protein coupled receptors family 1 profile domain-containing protein n=1 Tax=Sistotremastrum suecicum HHB10207 ss-3 TaxID=1314776 RepID=A0A166E431_9AGAM|nr:hypothetical protein SISSUDRAFT_1045954 [Sistotremastrum suecicum HHB10207 ss-3]